MQEVMNAIRAAFTAGFAMGQRASNTEAFNDGYDDGYTDGHADGEDDVADGRDQTQAVAEINCGMTAEEIKDYLDDHRANSLPAAGPKWKWCDVTGQWIER